MSASTFILFIVVGICVYAVACACAYFFSDLIIFPAPQASYQDGADILKLRSGDGETISAYYLEAEGAEKLLLYSHGNGEDIGSVRSFLENFRKHGIAVLAYDYPGYGVSTGRPSVAGCLASAQAAYSYAVEELGFAPGQITLYGRSLGSGPSCWLAERLPVGGLILEGAFTSTFRVVTRVKLLPFDKFDNLSRLSAIDCPMLLIHGERDFVVPFAHAKTNARALGDRAQTLWAPEAGHNNLVEIAGSRYWDAVIHFIR